MTAQAALVVVGALLAVGLFSAGLYQMARVAADRRNAFQAAEFHDSTRQRTALDDLDARVRSTRPGRWLARELDLAGVRQRPSLVIGAGLVVALVSTYVLWRIAPLLGFFGVLAGYLGIRAYLRREQARRREAFVAQLPELARVLANASFAGLSLPTAVAIAGEELAEPSRTELSRVADRLKFGASLPHALEELQERVGSRETKVLISTLVVSARSGGSLVSALREIAATLDQRKETRREIQTTLSQAVASSNLVIVLGFGMLLLVNAIKPGTVDRMTREPLGQAALLIGGAFFVGGWLVIRRMTRIEP
ncbi:MAG: type II secretion system F family protein [Kineosporiaceae bacterium]|nr:type II secretion system F family protein [Kineosporiaceae bacterium]